MKSLACGCRKSSAFVAVLCCLLSGSFIGCSESKAPGQSAVAGAGVTAGASGSGGASAATGGQGASAAVAGSAGDSATAGGSTSAGNGGSSGESGASGAGAQGGAGAQPDSPIVPVRLRTELRDAPLGIQTPTPRLSWELEAPASAPRGLSQTAYEVLVASSPEKLAAGEGDLLSTGVVMSADSGFVYAGSALASSARAHWKVRVRDQAGKLSAWSAPAEFTVGLLQPADWGAQWITGAPGAAPPLFRHAFELSKPVRRALLSICGLGQFELRINGKNVSDAVMEPSWTSYAKTCHYASYDVTQTLVQGPNAIGVLLGNGMYNVPSTPGRYTKFTGSFGPLKLIARLSLEFTDGSKDAVVSNTSWKTATGPITFTHIYGGEDFDARLEPAGWDRAGFNDAAWAAPTVVGGTPPRLIARSAPPVKVMQEFTPARVTEPQPGVFVYDLGQNFAGWPEITVQGAAGAVVRLTPGEALTAQGLVSQAGSGSPTWFSYTLKGGAAESWHPRFSYSGFRYVQVNGAVPMASAASFPDRPRVVSLTGKFLHAAAEKVGQFSSSDQDLNRIHALILAAMRSNLQTVLTDCPHREKLGWLETAHLLAPGIIYNYDVATFYEKILADMRDAQTADGLIPDIAPEMTVFSGGFRDSPEWGSSYVINPWTVYQMYGARRALEEHYAGMKRYVGYLSAKATQNILSYGLGDWYDVGPAAPGVSQLTSAGVTATAIWLQDLQVLQKTAELLGNSADASQFQASQSAITTAFNTRFLNAAGYYDRNSQTANAMPLALGIVPENRRTAVLASLVAAVTNAQHRVTAGDIGFNYLVRALSEAGRGDVLFAMLKQSTGPGYLYQINRGATSLSEAWDANPSSSQNHAMLGHAEAWLYNGLGGINPDPAGPGFKKFIVRPQPQNGLASVEVKYHSIRGPIATRWERAGTSLTLRVTVPVNTTATVHVPALNPAAVTEGGAPAGMAPGVVSQREESGALVVVVGSGQYEFVAP